MPMHETTFAKARRDFSVAARMISKEVAPLGFIASPDAPTDYDAARAEWIARRRPHISSLNSDATVFSCYTDNLHFRAWHDVRHFTTGGDFDTAGELRTWRAQRDDLRRWYGRSGRYYSSRLVDLEALLHCEVLGQLAYQQTWGDFPMDQLAFTQAFLCGGAFSGDALSRRF